MIEVNGAVSEKISAVNRAVLPGCTHATTMLQLILVPVVDELLVQHPSVMPSLVVDDLCLVRIGGGARVVSDLSAATRGALEGLKAAGLTAAVERSTNKR